MANSRHLQHLLFNHQRLVLVSLTTLADLTFRYAVQFYTPTNLLSRWQLLYMIVACISVAAGIVDWFCLPANPTKAWWLVRRLKTLQPTEFQTLTSRLIDKSTLRLRGWPAIKPVWSTHMSVDSCIFEWYQY